MRMNGKTTLLIALAIATVLVVAIAFILNNNRQGNTETVNPNNTEVAATQKDPLAPLEQLLPYSGDAFGIEWRYAKDGTRSVIIIPYLPAEPLLTKEAALAKHWSLYSERGRKAIAWLKSAGVAYEPSYVDWWNEDLWPEGKTIQ